MADRFDQAFMHVVGLEGGEVNDPDDPGGHTKYGISQRAYPHIDIAALTILGAKDIYFEDYWKVLRCGSLPWPLALFVFDCGVNQGNQVAAKLLQKVLGVTVDGDLGKVTLAKAAKADEAVGAMYLTERALRYATTKNFNKYGRGWFKRLFMIALEAQRCES